MKKLIIILLTSAFQFVVTPAAAQDLTVVTPQETSTPSPTATATPLPGFDQSGNHFTDPNANWEVTWNAAIWSVFKPTTDYMMLECKKLCLQYKDDTAAVAVFFPSFAPGPGPGVSSDEHQLNYCVGNTSLAETGNLNGSQAYGTDGKPLLSINPPRGWDVLILDGFTTYVDCRLLDAAGSYLSMHIFVKSTDFNAIAADLSDLSAGIKIIRSS